MSLLPILLVLLPLAGSLAVLGVRDALAARLGAVVSGIVLVVALATAVIFDYGRAGHMQMQTDVVWAAGIDVHLHLGVDGVSLPLVVLTALLTFLCLLYSVRVMPDGGSPRAFVALMLLLEVGMLGTFVALDLLLFFVFFEVVLIPMYFLISDWGADGRRAAAYKFILYTLLGSAVMLLGFLVVYTNTGTLDMVELAAARGEGMTRGVQVLAFAAMAVGFAVKTPMWPLHTWLPDAHTAAPTVGSVLLAGVLLKMGTYGLVRIALPVVPEGAKALAPYLGAFAVVGIVYGSLACLAQTDLKRLIAYSSVGHMGFVLLGIATLTPTGINGALFANIAHGLITGLLFFLAGGIKDRFHTAVIADLGGGMYQRTPRLGAVLAFAAVASLGLPGLAGFWGELLAMFAAASPAAGLPRGAYLTYLVVAALGMVLTAAYLLTVVRRVCMGASAQRWSSGTAALDLTRIEMTTWAPMIILIVALGLWPVTLLGLTDPAVQALLGGG
jgi:NADH-quinone oxidoreductase subunit M